MKLKKLISLGLAAVMTLALLAGCGNNASNKSTEKSSASSATSSSADSKESQANADSKEIVFPLEGDGMSFTGMALLWKDDYLLSDNLAWNTALERANIKVELTQLPRAEGAEKGKLIMASGDYPDFLYKMACLGDFYDYGSEGILRPLEDLIREYAPNMSALLDERNGWEIIASPDGHIYSLPNFTPHEGYGGNSVWWINKKWMDNLGLKEPTNMDELYEVLKAFKEKDANGNGDPNDEVPMSFYDTHYEHLLACVGDGVYIPGTQLAMKDNDLIYYPYTDGYKEFLAVMVKMYSEGLIDTNSFTQTRDQWLANAQSGDVVGMAYYTNSSMAPLEYSGNYVALMPFVHENYPLTNGVSKGTMAITDKCKNPEVLIAWADYFYTEEGSYLAWNGVKDVTYEYDAAGKYRVTGVTSGKYEHEAQFTLKGAANAPLNLVTSIYSDLWAEDNPPQALEAAKYEEGAIYSKGTVVPTFKFTTEEEEKLSTLNTDISGYLKNYVAKVITGELDLEQSWNEFQSTLKSMGADERLSIYKAAYDRITK